MKIGYKFFKISKEKSKVETIKLPQKEKQIGTYCKSTVDLK